MSQASPLLAKLPTDWDKKLTSEYMQGASDYEVMATLKITKNLFDALYNDPTAGSFKELVDFGRLMRKAWWYRQFRENLTTRGYQGNMLYNYMKNCFGWSDKTTTTTKGEEDLSAEELDARVEELIKKYRKVAKTV